MIGVYSVSKCYGSLIRTLFGSVEVAIVDVQGWVCHERIWIPNTQVAILEVSGILCKQCPDVVDCSVER